MDDKAVDFQESQAMPGRPGKDTVIAILLALLPILAVAILIVTGYGGRNKTAFAPANAPAISDGPSLAREPAALIDEHATPGELMAMRWQAMAKFYEKNGLLTRPAADQFNLAPAWETVQAERLEAERQMALRSRYTTAPGWEQATLIDESAVDADQFTIAPAWETVQAERLEAERQMALRSPKPTAPGWEQAEGYATYTERYWKQAAESRPAPRAEEEAWDSYIHGR